MFFIFHLFLFCFRSSTPISLQWMMREKCENEATSLSLIFLLLFSVTLSSWEPSWKKKCEWEREERSPSEDFESSRGELERKIATNNSTTLTSKQQGANKFWAWSLRRHEKRFYLSHNKLCISLSRVNDKVFFFFGVVQRWREGGENYTTEEIHKILSLQVTSSFSRFSTLSSHISHTRRHGLSCWSIAYHTWKSYEPFLLPAYPSREQICNRLTFMKWWVDVKLFFLLL